MNVAVEDLLKLLEPDVDGVLVEQACVEGVAQSEDVALDCVERRDSVGTLVLAIRIHAMSGLAVEDVKRQLLDLVDERRDISSANEEGPRRRKERIDQIGSGVADFDLTNDAGVRSCKAHRIVGQGEDLGLSQRCGNGRCEDAVGWDAGKAERLRRNGLACRSRRRIIIIIVVVAHLIWMLIEIIIIIVVVVVAVHLTLILIGSSAFACREVAVETR